LCSFASNATVPSEVIKRNLLRLSDLPKYSFSAIQLAHAVPVEEVSEIFVRVNSKGTQLSQADFILTLMSVYWDKGRKQLEDFSREGLCTATRSCAGFLCRGRASCAALPGKPAVGARGLREGPLVPAFLDDEGTGVVAGLAIRESAGMLVLALPRRADVGAEVGLVLEAAAHGGESRVRGASGNDELCEGATGKRPENTH